jgi:hypothetical protein
LTIELNASAPPQVASFGPKTRKVIVPVALAPPVSVAVSKMLPPSCTDGDAIVVRVGAAETTVVEASALLFSSLLSKEEKTEAVFV